MSGAAVANVFVWGRLFGVHQILGDAHDNVLEEDGH